MSGGLDPFDPEAWGDRPGCSAFEIALEMRERGALAPGALPVLDAHLSACDTCRDYAARLRRVDASLVASAAVPDWRRLRQKMNAALEETRRTPWLLVCVGIGVAVLHFALSIFFTRRLPPLKVFLLSIPIVVAAGVFGTYVRGRRLRRLLAEPDQIAAYRRWLEMSLKGLRRMRWWMPLYALWPLLQAIGAFRRYAAGSVVSGMFAVMGTLSFLVFVCLIIWSTRQSRRLAVELAELH